MSNYNAFRENYPAGFNGIEGKTETHIRGIHGEIHYEVYTNEDEDDAFEENKIEFIIENIRNGNIEIN